MFTIYKRNVIETKKCIMCCFYGMHTPQIVGVVYPKVTNGYPLNLNIPWKTKDILWLSIRPMYYTFHVIPVHQCRYDISCTQKKIRDVYLIHPSLQHMGYVTPAFVDVVQSKLFRNASHQKTNFDLAYQYPISWKKNYNFKPYWERHFLH